MAANRPVSDDELEQLPGRISDHFERVRDMLEQEAEVPKPECRAIPLNPAGVRASDRAQTNPYSVQIAARLLLPISA